MDAATERIGIERLIKDDNGLYYHVYIMCDECGCPLLGEDEEFDASLSDFKDLNSVAKDILDRIEEEGSTVRRRADGSVEFVCDDCAIDEG